jgi:cell wall-associated NlpC family hydrolase
MPYRWDSRECPGPISEATLHRPSACRALTAGAIALAVVTPALDNVEQANAAPVTGDQVISGSAPRAVGPASGVGLDPESAFATRSELAQRASRAMRVARTPGAIRPAGMPGAMRPAGTPGAMRPGATTVAGRRGARAPGVRENVAAASRRPTGLNRRSAGGLGDGQRRAGTRIGRTRTVRRLVTRVVTRRLSPARASRQVRLGNMTAVIAYARSQVGKSYVSGGEGPGGFDCSGLTRSAYARAGIRLPHSSGAQAARARSISRSQARAGDLVVGPGHVGIYMGHGMMIDAGNHRTGVVYRKLYSGLRVERL